MRGGSHVFLWIQPARTEGQIIMSNMTRSHRKSVFTIFIVIEWIVTMRNAGLKRTIWKIGILKSGSEEAGMEESLSHY